MNEAAEIINQTVPSNYIYDPTRQVYVTIKTVTPEVAKELLEGQIKNRPISKAVVRKYKEFMEQDQWQLNGEPIIFGGNKLIDGQHRLSACIESGKSFDAIWIELQSENSFRTLNQGKRRGGSDILSIAGHKNTISLYSAMCILAKIDESGSLAYQGHGSGSRKDVANHMTESELAKYPHLNISVQKVDPWYRKFRVKLGPLIALHYLIRCAESHLIALDDIRSASKADEFVRSLCLGLGLEDGNPILPFRNSLIKQMADGDRISPHFIIRGGLLTWNNWIIGKKVSCLRVGKTPKIPSVIKPA